MAPDELAEKIARSALDSRPAPVQEVILRFDGTCYRLDRCEVELHRDRAVLVLDAGDSDGD